MTPTTARKSSFIILVLLGLLVFVYHFGIGVYYNIGSEPSASFEFLYSSAFVCGIVWWLKADPGKSPVEPIYCRGLLVGVGWFIILPYHLLKTRGIRGWLPLLALFGSFLLGYILAAVVYIGTF